MFAVIITECIFSLKSLGLLTPGHPLFYDGSTINMGPLKGRTTPDLNNAGLFIRGGPDKDVAGTVLEDSEHEQNITPWIAGTAIWYGENISCCCCCCC